MTIVAGTVKFYEFQGEKPAMEGGHPVVVVSSVTLQRNGTAVIVPLTSELGNSANRHAVEISHRSLAELSRTGRSFAVCDKVTNVALTELRSFLKGRRQGQGINHVPNYLISRYDMMMIRLAVYAAINLDDDFNRLTRDGPLARWRERLRKRQAESKAHGRTIGMPAFVEIEETAEDALEVDAREEASVRVPILSAGQTRSVDLERLPEHLI